jgi:hypothetical protein
MCFGDISIMDMNNQQPQINWYVICIFVLNIHMEILSKVRKTNQQRAFKKWCLCCALQCWGIVSLESTQWCTTLIIYEQHNTKQKALIFFKPYQTWHIHTQKNTQKFTQTIWIWLFQKRKAIGMNMYHCLFFLIL